MDAQTGRRRRRSYSAEFKAEAVAACRKPGASTAGAALERSINANVLRRWVVEAERAAGASTRDRAVTSTVVASAKGTFVALPLTKSGDSTPIMVEVRRGAMTVSVQWPGSAMTECALWLRELFK